MPMTNDSTTSSLHPDTKTSNMKTPSSASLQFLRQFARVYYPLKGTNFSTMLAN